VYIQSTPELVPKSYYFRVQHKFLIGFYQDLSLHTKKLQYYSAQTWIEDTTIKVAKKPENQQHTQSRKEPKNQWQTSL